jgi:hypothetical protein
VPDLLTLTATAGRAIAGGERSGQDRRRNTFDERWHYLLD